MQPRPGELIGRESEQRAKLSPGTESVEWQGGASVPSHVPALPGALVSSPHPAPWCRIACVGTLKLDKHVCLLPCGHGCQAGNGAVNPRPPLSLQESKGLLVFSEPASPPLALVSPRDVPLGSTTASSFTPTPHSKEGSQAYAGPPLS